MRPVCTGKKHTERIHDCVEKIIHSVKDEMVKVSRHEHAPHIRLYCKQVDYILASAATAAYHSPDHAPVWKSVIDRDKHELACEKCGKFFTNKVIEAARELGIL